MEAGPHWEFFSSWNDSIWVPERKDLKTESFLYLSVPALEVSLLFDVAPTPHGGSISPKPALHPGAFI